MGHPPKAWALRDAGDWVDRAACAGTDHRLFFGLTDRLVTEARAVCAGCPVQAECLSYAMDNEEQFGVWGGLTVRERRALRRWERVAG